MTADLPPATIPDFIQVLSQAATFYRVRASFAKPDVSEQIVSEQTAPEQSAPESIRVEPVDRPPAEAVVQALIEKPACL